MGDSNFCAKSDMLLQNGEQNVPNIQSSHALAPFKGALSSGHSVANQGKSIPGDEINMSYFLTNDLATDKRDASLEKKNKINGNSDDNDIDKI